MKIIRISAIWCGSCIIMKKRYNSVINKYPSLEIINLDYDFDDISSYNVGNILPIAIFIDENNNELKRLIGETSEDEIIKTIEELK